MTPTPTATAEKTLSADLVSLAKRHIEFLRSLHAHGTTLSRPSQASLRRYSELWLPLVHTHPSAALVPPADVAWLWYCHRLAPFRYSAFCKARYGMPILEAIPPFTAHFDNNDIFVWDCDEATLSSTVSSAAELWTRVYPNEPFHLTEGNTQDQRPIDDSSSSILLDGFDILASTRRQATFLWQVSGPMYDDEAFLQEGLANYAKFLRLKRDSPANMVVVPTFQIDLFWHTHMLSNVQKYHDDCKAITGTLLYHDDSLNDRTEGGALDQAFNATKNAWRRMYNEEFHVVGGMYRGEPPSQYYLPTYVFDTKAVRYVQRFSDPTPASATVAAALPLATPMAAAKWTSLDGKAPDGQPAFIPTKQGRVNCRINGYIYGTGSLESTMGLGYYHHTTIEAYEILEKRITTRIEDTKRDIAMSECFNLCLSCGLLNGRDNVTNKQMEEVLAELEECLAIVTARSKAKAPFGIVDLPPSVASSATKRNTYCHSNGTWYFPAVLYLAGGGCGAVGLSAGGFLGGGYGDGGPWGGGGCGEEGGGGGGCAGFGGGGFGGGGCGGGGGGGGGCGGGGGMGGC